MADSTRRIHHWLITILCGSLLLLAGRPAEAISPICPQTPDYWRTHPGLWPVTSVVLGSPTNPLHRYTRARAITLLGLSSRRDASLGLAQQLIAARLSIAAGALAAPIETALAESDSLLAAFAGALPYNVSPASPVGAAMAAQAHVLSYYTRGVVAGSCRENQPPVANAGPDQTVPVGTTVHLSASGSTDIDGDRLNFRWKLVSYPAGSRADLRGANTVNATLEADVAGVYELSLAVYDDRDQVFEGVTITAGAGNAPPLANAGPDQTHRVGDTAQLDGTGSSDPDGDALSYAWTFAARPASSQAVLTGASGPTPSFVVDAAGGYTLQLVVSDGTQSSTDTVSISTINSPPVADAGANGTAAIGEIVTLNGTGSSDADGDPLTFSWSFVARPDGSQAALIDSATPTPRFVLDVVGDYVVQLVVNDGAVSSQPDTVVITTRNTPPVANAGVDQQVFTGALVTLDGSGSSDVDGNTLTYRWALTTTPGGSAVSLSEATAVRPTFTPDLPGTYVAQLIVHDGVTDSPADTVVITAGQQNRPPVAEAGGNQTVALNATVQLDGSASNDPDGDALTYAWTLTTRPATSQSTLAGPATSGPTFTADAPGTYVAQLIVSDGALQASDTVTISTSNSLPVANAGSDQVVTAGATVTLDGTASSDPDGTPLTFAWSLLSRPASSAAVLSGDTTATSGFVADVAGDYVAQLIVSDGQVASAPDTVTITVNPIVQNAVDLRLRLTDVNNGPPLSGNVSVGQSITYVLFLTNGGPNDAANVAVQLPAFVGITAFPTLGTWDAATRRWTLPSASASASTLMRLVFSVLIPATGSIAADIVASSAQPDVNPADNVMPMPFLNRPPVANAGPDLAVATATTAVFDGSGSVDHDGDALTYAWTLATRPANSSAVVDNPANVQASLRPDKPGTYRLELRVTDVHGVASVAVDSATLVATGDSQSPVITSTPITAAAVAQAYTYDVQAQDPDAGDTLTYSLDLFPAGMTIGGSTGLVQWVPDAGGPRAVTVRVTDTRGLQASQSFTVQVSSAANRAPQAADDAYEARVGDALNLASPGLLANDSDADGAPLAVRVRQAPANGQLFTNADGSFTYTPHDLESGGLVRLNEVNLAAVTPGLVLATSSNAQLTTPQMSVDDDISTFWRGIGQAGFFELTFPSDVTVTAIEVLGGRQAGLTHTTEASLQFFDTAGVLLHDSGTISLTAPGDLSYAAPAVARVRRVRYNALRGTVINAEVHIAEFRVIGSALVARTPQQIPHLGQRLATTAIASSSVPGRSPESAIDGRNQTDWYAVTQAAGEFLELQFPAPVTVTGITGGNPAARPDGFGTSTPIACTGTFELLADDSTVLFSSGVIAEPTGFSGEPFTIGVPAVSGVRRARYVSAGCAVSSFPPGFSELRVLGTADIEAAPFNARLKYQALFGREVHSTPVVINLTDDNFDGVIDARDVPEIVVPVETVGNQLTGEIKVLSGDDGRELRTMGAGLVSPWSELAAGDIDGDGLPEIVAVHADGNHLIAFEHDGTQKWISAANTMPRFNLGNGIIIGGAVAIANLDASGPPEVIVGASVFTNTGALLGDGRTLGGTTAGGSLRTAASAVADIDLDGIPELVAGPTAYRLVGGALQVVWRRTDRPDGYVAIGNFDDDPYAEIAVVANGVAYLLNHDGSDAEVWNAPSHAPLPLPGGGMGGAPTVADLDGDGRPEIGVAASINFIVFDRTGQVRWKSAVSDLSSNSTGSTVFDFDGDGLVEVVYRDEAYLRIYRGRDGLLLYTTPVSSTTWGEEPVVADTDNDGHAEVVVSSNGPNGRGTGVLVFEDIADQWTRTRRIWNQHAYDVTGVNEDGTIPLRPTPNWTLTGLNTFRLNAFVGGATPDGTDSFTYVATDGELESNEATVRIAVRPRNSAPIITSDPALTAATGVPYLYAVVANDPDAGDILTFSLETSPAGVTIDSLSGLVRWTPVTGDLGPHAVVVKVADARGRFALQGYTLTVAAPIVVPNVVGLAQAVASTTITAAGLATGSLSTRNSPTVAAGLVISQNPSAGTNAAPATPVGLVVSLGAAAAGVVPNVVGMTQTAAQGDIAAAGFAVGTVTGRTSSTPTGIVLAQTPAAGTTSTVGAAIALVVSLGPPPGTLDLDGDGYTGDMGDCDDTNAARHPGAIDIPGDGIDQNCNGVDSIAGDLTAPIALLVTPDDLAVITVPTDIIGTATDSNFLRYTVQLSPAGTAAFTTIGRGTTAVTSAVVGRLDPTLLENGLYTVRLVAEDVNGAIAIDERAYQVDGQAKVGAMQIAFVDLEVPLAGVPITVIRRYDSRVKTARDFGVGWTLDIRTGSVRHNRTPGLGWIIRDQPFLGNFLPCVGGTSETRTHLTEVRLSERESYKFALTVENGNLGIAGACEGVARFRFIAGTRGSATLDIVDSPQVIYVRGGTDEVLDMQSFLDGGPRPFNPRRVRLTTSDGRTIEFDTTVGVTRVADRNGNAIDVSAAGIRHSSGRSIAFTRDAAGRIVRMTDPSGASLEYTYDAAGDLVTVLDRAGDTMSFVYDAAHNLVEMADALGRSVRREYDSDGRLVGLIDADGQRTALTRDLDARRESITDRLGRTTTLEYDVRGNILQRTDALGQVTTFTYDAGDNLLTETNPFGDTTTRTYDDRGNVLTLVDAEGRTTSTTYNAFNQVLTRTDPRGGVVTSTYDSRGNLATETDARAPGRCTSTTARAAARRRPTARARRRPTNTIRPVAGCSSATRSAR